MLFHTVATADLSNSTSDNVFVEARRYTAADAKQVVQDARRSALACLRYNAATESSTELKQAHARVTWTVLDQGFAGDESVLIRQRNISYYDGTGNPTGHDFVVIYAIVRVDDMATILEIDQDAQARMRALAKKAAVRLCEASAAC